ncbi:daunorubicin resistance protein DrrA family ABC transporter ATP-binding protein [Georgenia halophila]|uniref:Daunorubicin resistance protein DrrA family ABC transporter ATP-binding protein n=1 Tax=Georgenia halophila TaxID=620889 RepID=A0ABP8LGU6_9MICO
MVAPSPRLADVGPRPGSPAVEVHELRRSFGGREVLKDVSVSVEPGTLLALLGPNGSGKTTTVRILTTLLRPHGGSVHIGGYDVVRQAAHVRGIVGLTAQQATVDDILTGRENLELLGQLHRLGRGGARRRAGELLGRFGLAEAADRRVATYSGGMRRRIDLAASLVAAPSVLFLDEPTTGLDPRSRHGMWEVIRGLLGDGTTVLLTTQYLEEADQLADDVAVLREGRIVAAGSPQQLKRRVGEERLTLRVSAGAAERARRLLGALTDPAGTRDDSATTEVTLALRDPDHLRRCLDDLASAGIEVLDVDLRRPTLDDVFFSLTDQEVAA